MNKSTKGFRIFLAFLLSLFIGRAIAETIPVSVGDSGHPGVSTPGSRATAAINKLIDLGKSFGPGDLIIADFQDGWTSKIEVSGEPNNMVYKEVAHGRTHERAGSGFSPTCNTQAVQVPVGYWTFYSASVNDGGVVTESTVWEFVITGWETEYQCV